MTIAAAARAGAVLNKPELIAAARKSADFVITSYSIHYTKLYDTVFNLCEGFWGDSRKEMHVAALLDLLGYAYTGAAPLSLGLTQDKVRTKDLLMRHGLPTPKYILVKMGEHFPKTRDLAYPLIVKPRFEDASLGITLDSIVESESSLKKRIQYIHDTYRQGALVEEFIEGREINAAVLGNSYNFV